MATHRHRGGGFPFARIFAIVIALHVLGGLGFLWLAKSSTGQELMKTYNIKLLQPPKPPEPEQVAEKPPPPPPPKTQDVAPPPAPTTSAPSVASVKPSGPSVGGGGGGGGGGLNWNGGKFVGGFEEGPLGMFKAALTQKFRSHYREPQGEFGVAALDLVISETGSVRSYRLSRSSGHSANDQAILVAAAELQSEGAPKPPDGKGGTVTIELTPTY